MSIQPIQLSNRTKEMDEKIYELANLEIWNRNGHFFVRYDAGAHQRVIREDEISKDDALHALKGPQETNDVLLKLQKHLIVNGLDPYTSNLKTTEL